MPADDLLKVSKFNYSCVDQDGNLLLCNFSRGQNSFSKVLKNNVDKYNIVMGSENIILDENKSYIGDLYNRGFLVNSNVDEYLRVQSLYYNNSMADTLSLIVMPTEQCNFRCKYCYELFEKGKMTVDDQKALLKFIQKRTSHSSRIHISWFGGEPLEAFDVVEYITKNVMTICSNKKIGYSANMTTNAYNLNAGTFDKLYKMRIYSYQITLDGFREQHDKQRIKLDGSGTFDKIVENLLYIKNSPQYKLALITIRINVTKEILENLDEFLRFYKLSFGEDKRFEIRFAITGNFGGEKINDITDKLVDGDTIYEGLSSRHLYEDKLINFADALKAFIPMNLVCYAASKNSFTIGSDLSIYKCTIHFNPKENHLGKILSNGDTTIDEDLHNKWYIKNIEKQECKSCFYFPCCYNASCPLKSNFDIFEDKCSSSALKKNLKNYMLFLSNKLDFKIINF
ncbi:MAG: SPASM domain-containing protein [Oscillospiraceae bacterium]|nr:SPASM domain-containing protein [Oscillospiraceae bacterium]